MKKIIEAVKVTKEVTKAAEAVESALSLFKTVAPFLSAAGYVLSFIEMFEPSDTEIILDAIEKIATQIANL
jgi:hypothetical protein